jgi:hypothetical protein
MLNQDHYSLENKALYNCLRLNWLADPSSVSVEEWQVEDYRTLPVEDLLQRLSNANIRLDRPSFIAFADNAETPEELTDILLGDSVDDPVVRDKIYLPVFELWRRFVPDKLSLTIFCDELDHQIQLYDEDNLDQEEELHDILANLQIILEENVDAGVDPVEAFQTLSEQCANDLESFLYNFIADQIDVENESYAATLIDDFKEYVEDAKWFDLLSVRLQYHTETQEAVSRLRKLAVEALEEKNLVFNLELLAFLAEVGESELFLAILKPTIPLLEIEEDFQDLLELSVVLCQFTDRDDKEQAIQEMLDAREDLDPVAPLVLQDSDVQRLLKLLA